MRPRSVVVPDAASLHAERCRRQLLRFVESGWSVLEPGRPFVRGFHLEAIAEHLEAVSRGQIRKLLINLPPRHMKSLAVAVFWPMWEWTRRPDLRFVFASYARELAERDSVKCRRLIESPWYQQHWGSGFQLTSDQNVKTRFENDRLGVRLATSVDSVATGEGGDRIVVDDPHNVRTIDSEATRTATLRWWDESMSTRLNSPKTGAFIIVMHRVHRDDLAGHVLEQGGYEHLCLPAEYEGRKTVTVTGWTDPRTVMGELLWPAQFDAVALRDLKASLGSIAAAGQLQQHPVPPGGALFKREWFSTIDVMPRKVTARCRFWDCAATAGGGDWTVGVKTARLHEGRVVIEHVVRGQWSPADVDQIIRQTAVTDGRGVRIREEQEPGSAGKAVTAARARLLAGFDYRGLPATGDKVTRWRPLAAQAEAGNVLLLRGGWTAAWLDEVTLAPQGRHDDQLDAAAGAFEEVTRRGATITKRKITGF